jgi:hypothetical protein
MMPVAQPRKADRTTSQISSARTRARSTCGACCTADPSGLRGRRTVVRIVVPPAVVPPAVVPPAVVPPAVVPLAVVSLALDVSPCASRDAALRVFPRMLPRIDGAAGSAKPVLPFSIGMRDVRPIQKVGKDDGMEPIPVPRDSSSAYWGSSVVTVSFRKCSASHTCGYSPRSAFVAARSSSTNPRTTSITGS